MLGKLSIAGAVAAILMNPTALPAQVGGAINAGAAVRGAVVRGFLPRRISVLRVRRMITVASTGTLRFRKRRADGSEIVASIGAVR